MPQEPLTIGTSLSDEHFQVVNARVTEGLSSLFVIEVDAVVEPQRLGAVRSHVFLGEKAHLHLALPLATPRTFWGIVSRFAETGHDDLFTYVHFQIVPDLWRLTLNANCRIFQDESIPQIAEKILAERQIDFVPASDGRPPREYCVQYRESDYNFVARLLEDEGIFYFFEHDENGSRLALASELSSCPVCPGLANVAIEIDRTVSTVIRLDRVLSWQRSEVYLSGAWSLGDYHFEHASYRPTKDFRAPGEVAADGSYDVYDYPGYFAPRFHGPDTDLQAVNDEGERVAHLRGEEEVAKHRLYGGSSSCPSFSAGHSFVLHDRNPGGAGGSGARDKYVLTAVTHTISQPPPRSGGEAGVTYLNKFYCLESDSIYRPARTLRKPVVQGIQTATVSGPRKPDGDWNQEIWTDRYGRVRLLFHWDREHQAGAAGLQAQKETSCWVRVAQVWAGAKFGAYFIPRCGDEVAVAFLEGDPDQPLVIGSLYNNMRPYPYGDAQRYTVSGFKTHSTAKGQVENYNELRFEDAKGQEEILLHAERALTVVVEGSESRSIGGTRSTTISNAGKNPAPIADKLTIKKGDRDTTLTEGSDIVTLTKGDHTLTLTQGNETHTITAGDSKLSALAGTAKIEAKAVEISGLTQVKISCGASTITLTPAMIEIKSTVVTIQGTPVKIN